MQDKNIKLESVDHDPSTTQTESKTVNQNNNREKFICDLCGLTLFSISGMRRHIKSKHLGQKEPSANQLKTEVCTICGDYTTKRNFKDHVDSHSTARKFKCELCGSAVKSIFTLRKHIKRLHFKIKSTTEATQPDRKVKKVKDLALERKFKCNYCDLRFARQEFLKNHLIKHKAEWSYDCGLCRKIFKHSSSVSGHRKSHKVNGFYHCGCCDAQFKDYGQLRAHFDDTDHRFIDS